MPNRVREPQSPCAASRRVPSPPRTTTRWVPAWASSWPVSYTHLDVYKRQYNDWWVQGRTISQVEARYGPFDISRNGVLGYYIYTDNGPIMPDHLPHYYYLEYEDVYKRQW